jgi:hypothetical protein
LKRTALLLLPLILSIGITSVLPNTFAQVSNPDELEECRDGLIIVFIHNGNTYTCKEPQTAERWQELGIATIIDPNYIPIIEEPEEEKLSIFQRIALKNQEKENPPSAVGLPEEKSKEPEKPLVEFFDHAEVETTSTTSEQATETTPKPSDPPTDAGKPEFAGKPEDKPDLPGKPTDRPGFSGVKASGWVLFEVYDKDGNLKHRHENHNLVVDNGLQALADLAFGTTHVSGESAGGFTWISVGTSGTAPAAGQTDCIAQHGAKKQDLTVTNTALGAVINVSWVAELAGGSLQEICLTDNGAAATGNLFARQTYTAVPILATDTVNAQWTITFADSNGT